MSEIERVSEEELQSSFLILSTLADDRYKAALAVFRRVAAERSSLEEARREAFREVIEAWKKPFNRTFNAAGEEVSHSFIDWLLSRAEGAE